MSDNIFINLFHKATDLIHNDNDLDQAEKILKSILKKGYINTLYHWLGILYVKKQDFQKGITYFNMSISKKENLTSCYFRIGVCYSIIGDIQNSIYFFTKVTLEEFNVHTLSAFFKLSEIFDLSKQNDFGEKIKKLLNKDLTKEETRIALLILGKYECSQKNYMSSFDYYEQSNRIKSDMYYEKFPHLLNITYNNDYNIITRRKINTINNNNHTSPKMIFIIGLPRSGSTLLEKILVTNTEILTLGENSSNISPYLYNEDDNKDYKDFIKNIDFKKSKYILSKQLFYFKHIDKIIHGFPDVKIIHSYRNPLDNILSIYFTDLVWNNHLNDGNLDNIIDYYIFYRNIMKHWKEIYANRIYDCNYDNLVNNPNDEIKNLIDYIGLDWSENYLNHSKMNNTICNTASVMQCRKPIYKTSSKKWEKYKDFIQPQINKLISLKIIPPDTIQL